MYDGSGFFDSLGFFLKDTSQCHPLQEARARQLRDNISVAFCGLFLLGAFAVPLVHVFWKLGGGGFTLGCLGFIGDDYNTQLWEDYIYLKNWVVVSYIFVFYFHPEPWGNDEIWLIFLNRGWNHQLEKVLRVV